MAYYQSAQGLRMITLPIRALLYATESYPANYQTTRNQTVLTTLQFNLLLLKINIYHTGKINEHGTYRWCPLFVHVRTML